MFCPRCGTIAVTESGPCDRCGGTLSRPDPAAPASEPPAVRAPTERGERAQRAAGIHAESLPKAPPRPRPAPPEWRPAAAPPVVQPPDAGPAPAAPETPAIEQPAIEQPAIRTAPVESWPPPPAHWEPTGTGGWLPPAAPPPSVAADPEAWPPPAGWPPPNVWPPPPESTPAWAPPVPAAPPDSGAAAPPPYWAPQARQRTGWSRPSGGWWGRLLGSPAAGATAYAGATPPTYFWQSLVCLFLFLPTGVAAVAYSLLVTKRAQVGDGAGSVRASQLARLWCVVTLVLFALVVILSIVTGFKA